jgi:hypothetical protein
MSGFLLGEPPKLQLGTSILAKILRAFAGAELQPNRGDGDLVVDRQRNRRAGFF